MCENWPYPCFARGVAGRLTCSPMLIALVLFAGPADSTFTWQSWPNVRRQAEPGDVHGACRSGYCDFSLARCDPSTRGAAVQGCSLHGDRWAHAPWMRKGSWSYLTGTSILEFEKEGVPWGALSFFSGFLPVEGRQVGATMCFSFLTQPNYNQNSKNEHNDEHRLHQHSRD